MKGTIKTERVVLDYTDVAAPILITDIKADLDALYKEDRPNPDLIKLWRHQFDYLIKTTKAKYGSVAEHLEGGDRIWGVKLEVKDPPQRWTITFSPAEDRPTPLGWQTCG